MADWDEVIEDFLNGQAGYAKKTEEFHKSRLAQLRAWTRRNGRSLEDFKAADMRTYIKERSNSVGERTRSHDCRVAKVFFKFCVKEKYLKRDPLHDYVVPKPPRAHIHVPCPDDLQRLLQAVHDRWTPHLNHDATYQSEEYRKYAQLRDRAIICFLVETACRISEALAVTTDEIDFKAKTVVFPKTKGKDPRTVPITDALINEMRPWLVEREKASEMSKRLIETAERKNLPAPPPMENYIFLNRVGAHMDNCNWQRSWNAYIKHADLKAFTRHSLRHFSLRQIAKKNVHSAQQIAGHKHLNTTQGYLRDDPDQVRADHAEVNALGKILVNARSQKVKRARLA